MTRPRFVISSVTGYSISSGKVSYSRTPPTIWYVWDTDYAWKVVAEFKGGPGSGWNRKEHVKARAEKLAAELNLLEAAA